MSVAIYGDSFADSGNNAQAWPKLLEEILNTNIDNFAVSASSAVYSYSVFLKNYKNYEKNIFVLTHSNSHQVGQAQPTNSLRRIFL